MSSLSLMLVIFLLSLLFHLLMIKISKNQQINVNGLTSFECGFNPKSSSLIPYSSQYFLLTVLFLIFDLEIALFIPSVMIENLNQTAILTSSAAMTMMYLIFMMEWKMSMIKWSK